MTPGRFGAAIVAVLALTAALFVMGEPAPVEAAVMCPPVKIDDLFPPEPPPPTAPRPQECAPFVYPLTWPVTGGSHVISSFGADRDGGARHHEGIDIQASKLTPVLAAADGTVARVTQERGTEDCCSIVIRHNDGWQSVYVHLNNDLYGTDDGMGIGVRPDLEVGAEVVAGEVIGWIGDSGNAEDGVDHLHFELRTREGVAVDPAASLRKARLVAELPETEPIWPYVDDEARDMQWVAARLLTEGLFLPCDGPGLNFCPEEVADPEFVRDIARHLTGVEPPLVEGRMQEIPQVFESLGDEQRVISELLGCQTLEPCLDVGVPATELARIAAWALDQPPSGALIYPTLVMEMGQNERLPEPGDAEAQLRARGVIGMCRPPLDNEKLVTREGALTSLVRWIAGPMADCVDMTQLRR